MRRVRLTSAVKTDYPPVCGDAGAVLNLPDHAAQFVVTQKLGEYYGPEEQPGPSRTELERKEKEAEVAAAAQAAASAGSLRKMQFPGEEPKPEERRGEGNEITEPAAEDGEPLKRPYGNAPKSAWQRYACVVDSELTPERAELMTKADLMSKYGERL